MRNLVIALSITVALLAGCIIGATASQLVVPPVRAGTKVHKWQYSCFREGESDTVREVSQTLNRYGAHGWELAVAGSDKGHFWCFKRRLP